MTDTKVREILNLAGLQAAELDKLERRLIDKKEYQEQFKEVNLVQSRWRNHRSQMEDKAKLEQDFVDALIKEIEKKEVPIITRDATAADIRIGSRLYEFKVRYSKGELDHIKLIQLKKIHPDILEPTHIIKWNHMFDQVMSYCQMHQTHTIRPSDDKRKEKLRWWLSNQIKLINSYFKQHDNRSSDDYIDHSRHNEMIRRDRKLTKNGLKADRIMGHVNRSKINIQSKDPDLDKRRLIRHIDHYIELLKKDHNTDYVSVLKERIEKKQAERELEIQKRQQSLRDSRKKYEILDAIAEPVSDELSDDHKPY